MKQSRFIRNIWLGVENLLLHKLRSFLTMLGVVFGAGSVVAMLAVDDDGLAIEWVPKHMRTDKDLCIAAMTSNGLELAALPKLFRPVNFMNSLYSTIEGTG